MGLIREFACRLHTARLPSILSGLSTIDQGTLVLYYSVWQRPIMSSQCLKDCEKVCVYCGWQALIMQLFNYLISSMTDLDLTTPTFLSNFLYYSAHPVSKSAPVYKNILMGIRVWREVLPQNIRKPHAEHLVHNRMEFQRIS